MRGATAAARSPEGHVYRIMNVLLLYCNVEKGKLGQGLKFDKWDFLMSRFCNAHSKGIQRRYVPVGGEGLARLGKI